MTAPASYVSTTNACKLCKPLGAAIAFRGIAGCVPFLHGSQGCATYMRRYIISHFNEPIDIASSSLGEKHAVYGGAANLKLGLNNVIAAYRPKLIGVATTCLTETIGDNVPMILQEYRGECGLTDGLEVVHVSTPSYGGTHMEGFHAALRAVVMQLAGDGEHHQGINLLGGFVSTADLRYLKAICTDFGLDVTLLPDYSETLDGEIAEDYHVLPNGGTPLSAIRAMGGARATIELGATLPAQTAGTELQQRFDCRLERVGLPIGIRATDRLLALLAELSGQPIPSWHRGARGRLIDALVDGHKYCSGKRAVVYGEEDLVVGMAAFLAEIGIRPVLCGSGGKSGRLRQAIGVALEDLVDELPAVYEDIDFYDIEQAAADSEIDLLVGNSKGYACARRLQVPLVRVGFPIHDRIGGQRILHLGYQGAQVLFDQIINTLIEKKQNDSPVGYSYM
jgi:nitrogenase molybdenum-iron protein NifN